MKGPNDTPGWVHILVILALLACSGWFTVAAPCSWWRFSKVADVPARCVSVVKR